MTSETKPRKLNLLARALKKIGAATDPKQTFTGKVWSAWERGMTGVFEKLAASPTYLDVAGKMMEQGFFWESEMRRSTESILRMMRLPTASELHDVQDQLRRVREQNEALGLQLEVALSRLEALQSKEVSHGA